MLFEISVAVIGLLLFVAGFVIGDRRARREVVDESRRRVDEYVERIKQGRAV
jgi:hypothetical protein